MVCYSFSAERIIPHKLNIAVSTTVVLVVIFVVDFFTHHDWCACCSPSQLLVTIVVGSSMGYNSRGHARGGGREGEIAFPSVIAAAC